MMPSSFSHLVRATLAIVLTITLPVVLYTKTAYAGTQNGTDVVQVYLDALAAVVAFYFGASTKSN